jgi:hypothetical protein
MDLTDKKYLYVNGSSVSAGGGFEEYQYRKDVRDSYLQFGYSLPDTKLECTYAHIIATELNLELINDAKSGSGIDRLIRTTMKWIDENPTKINETIFIFEIQMGIRLDWYVKEWGDYGVLNAAYNENKEYPFTLVKEWFTDDTTERVKWNQKYKNSIDGYFNNFFDHDVKHLHEETQLILFISYLNQFKLNYLISVPNDLSNSHTKIIHKIIPPTSNLANLFDGYNVWNYCRINQMLILNELAGSNSDNHIGYLGNIKIGKQISNFIKFGKKDVLRTIKVHNIHNAIHFLKKILQTTHINLVNENNIKNCDFILLSGFDRPTIDDYFYRSIEEQIHLKKYALIKKFFIIYYNEKMNHNILNDKLEYLHIKLGIPIDNIFYIESSVTDLNPFNQIPLELKIRNYNKYLTSYDTKSNSIVKTKKFCCLNNKSNLTRFMVLDSIIYHYDDIDKLKNENIISYRTVLDINSIIKADIVPKNKIDLFSNIGLPWSTDSDSDIFGVGSNDTANTYYQNSVFSIISETQNADEPYLDGIDSKFDNLQFSEKTLLPILNGNLPFIIQDGLLYEKFEEIGFDFGYLKEIFGIDYKSNTFIGNLNSIELVINFIKYKSIYELNEIRQKNIRYIDNNLKIITQLLGGDLTENEIEFFNKILNGSIKT